MLELQKKIQELEISLQEAKAKQAVPPSGIKSQQVVIDKSISAAISTGATEAELCVFLKRILLPHLVSLLKF
jgi:hypothetical protein